MCNDIFSHSQHTSVSYMATSFDLKCSSSSGHCTRTWMNRETKYHEVGVVLLCVKNFNNLCTMSKSIVNCSSPKDILGSAKLFVKIQRTRNLCSSEIWILCLSTAIFLKERVKKCKYLTWSMLRVSLDVCGSTLKYRLRFKFFFC